jgi:hypothetical protein
MKATLFGRSAVNQADDLKIRNPNGTLGRLWGLTSVTPGLIAYSATTV